MNHRSVIHRSLGQSLAGVFFACVVLYGVATVAVTPRARADVVAYLVNVHMRPGYNFPNADAALGYGYGICDTVAAGRAFPEVMGDVRGDFNTSGDYQASYLISQAVNELCPAQIWRLRNSAAHYKSPPGITA
jgi:Protein of unknown function (DUF732)